MTGWRVSRHPFPTSDLLHFAPVDVVLSTAAIVEVILLEFRPVRVTVSCTGSVLVTRTFSDGAIVIVVRVLSIPVLREGLRVKVKVTFAIWPCLIRSKCFARGHEVD